MLDFTTPEVTESINKLCYQWPAYKLRIVADRIDDKGKAELWFYHSNGKAPDALLHTTSVNLLSTSTMNQLVKRMETNSAETPWQQCLTYIAKTAMEYQRRGEPGEILQPIPGTVKHPGYYIEPLLLKGLPNLIHGAKGANKTTLGLVALGLCANGVNDSMTGLVANEEARVGILDWENDKDTTIYNISCLIEAQTIPYFEPAYLRCSLPLVDDVQKIADWVTENRLDIVLIDSLGQAAGTDSFDSSGKRAALRFFQASRQLKVTTLIIGQESKNEEGKKTIYGSVYFQYYARNIFELKATKDPLDPKILHLALFHTDANFSGLHEPLGFRTTYEPGSTLVESEEVKLSQFLERASQTNNLLEFLKSGAQSVNAVAKELALSDNRVRVMLSRAKKRGLVIDLGSGMWGLLEKNGA